MLDKIIGRPQASCRASLRPRESHSSRIETNWISPSRIVTNVKRGSTKVIYVYFSYCLDHPYLLLSIRSLYRKALSVGDEVIVFSDPESPLTHDQQAQLKSEFPGVTVRTGFGRTTGYGKLSVNSEIAAFRNVAEAIHLSQISTTFIAKIDSDVIFLSHGFRDSLERTSTAILGEYVWHFRPLLYLQGGAYFIKAEYCQRMPFIDDEFVDAVVTRMNQRHIKEGVAHREGTVGEDAAISLVISNLLDGSMGEISDYRMSIRHFIGEKQKMLLYKNYQLFWFRYRAPQLIRSALKRMISLVPGQ